MGAGRWRQWPDLGARARAGQPEDTGVLRRAPAPEIQDCAAEMPMVPADESDAPLFDALDRCLTELSVDERALIEAFYFKGGSHQSVAKQENTTPKAVDGK